MKNGRTSVPPERGGGVCSAGRLVALVSVGLLAAASTASAADATPAAPRSEAPVSATVAPTSSAPPWSRVVSHFRRTALRLPELSRLAASHPGPGSALAAQVLQRGTVGWEVAALQLLVAEAGFASGPIDGYFGARTEAAIRRYQTWLGFDSDGIAGPETLRALAVKPPLVPGQLLWPVRAPITSAFGPRAGRFHAGIDLSAPLGTTVAAARPGRVTWAGWRDGGWGNLVVVAHGDGVRSLYAHLDSIDVRLGQLVAAGARIGGVGQTGRATGPHLHFEIRLRGASVDPELALR